MRELGTRKAAVLWQHFEALSAIPRSDGQDEQAIAWLERWAVGRALPCTKDVEGNLLVRVPASPGREQRPTVLLQAHVDMVGVAEGDFDFASTPLSLRREGDWILAQGTSLGADNGIGVAAAMAMAESGLEHGPLELLFTVEEETTMRGARGLDLSASQASLAINLDSEEPGVIFVGSAGGGEELLGLPLEWRPPHGAPDGDVALAIELNGLKGGHSGMEIGLRRANAIKQLTEVLWELRGEVAYSLAELVGGQVSNAIPNAARAVIVVGRSELDEVAEFLAAAKNARQLAWRNDEPGFELRLSEQPKPLLVLSTAHRDRLLRLLLALPHGPAGSVPSFAGVIETSCNLALVATGPDEASLELSSRSSNPSALRSLRAQIAAAAELAGAMVRSTPPYPAWQPRASSALAALAAQQWRALRSEDAALTVVHAGLECGYLSERMPALDIISIGPLILEAHTPRERVNVPSVDEFHDFLTMILRAV